MLEYSTNKQVLTVNEFSFGKNLSNLHLMSPSHPSQTFITSQLASKQQRNNCITAIATEKDSKFFLPPHFNSAILTVQK